MVYPIARDSEIASRRAGSARDSGGMDGMDVESLYGRGDPFAPVTGTGGLGADAWGDAETGQNIDQLAEQLIAGLKRPGTQISAGTLTRLVDSLATIMTAATSAIDAELAKQGAAPAHAAAPEPATWSYSSSDYGNEAADYAQWFNEVTANRGGAARPLSAEEAWDQAERMAGQSYDYYPAANPAPAYTPAPSYAYSPAVQSDWQDVPEPVAAIVARAARLDEPRAQTQSAPEPARQPEPAPTPVRFNVADESVNTAPAPGTLFAFMQGLGAAAPAYAGA